VAAAAAAGGGGSGVRMLRAHADVWAALPNLEELQVESQNEFAGRGGRFFISTL
jgi:acetyl/propionyl-CoA carboxylase alpha subunit